MNVGQLVVSLTSEEATFLAGMRRADRTTVTFEATVKRLMRQGLDPMTARMGQAAQGAAAWDAGMRRMTAQGNNAAAMASRASVNTDQWARQLVRLAGVATGVGGPIGKLAELAGTFAFGGAFAIAALAVGALALAYRRLTADQRAAREENQALTAGLVQQARDALTPSQKALQAVNAALSEQERLLDRIQRIGGIARTIEKIGDGAGPLGALLGRAGGAGLRLFGLPTDREKRTAGVAVQEGQRQLTAKAREELMRYGAVLEQTIRLEAATDFQREQAVGVMQSLNQLLKNQTLTLEERNQVLTTIRQLEEALQLGRKHELELILQRHSLNRITLGDLEKLQLREREMEGLLRGGNLTHEKRLQLLRDQAAIQAILAERMVGIGRNLGALLDPTRNGATAEEEEAMRRAAGQKGPSLAMTGVGGEATPGRRAYEKALEKAKLWQQAWKNAVEAVQTTLADMFESMFDKGANFLSLLHNLLRTALRISSELFARGIIGELGPSIGLAGGGAGGIHANGAVGPSLRSGDTFQIHQFYTIHAVDARSFQQLVRDNRHVIGAATGQSIAESRSIARQVRGY